MFTNNDWRAALADEPVDGWKEVSGISNPCSFACVAERLAWEGGGPYGQFFGPSGEPEGVVPPTDSGEKVDASKSGKLGWNNIVYISGVYGSWGDKFAPRKLPEPRALALVPFIVVRVHGRDWMVKIGIG